MHISSISSSYRTYNISYVTRGPFRVGAAIKLPGPPEPAKGCGGVEEAQPRLHLSVSVWRFRASGLRI